MKKENNSNKVIEFGVDFGGFYESIHSYNIERDIASCYGVDEIDDMQDKDYDSINWQSIENQYGKEWLDCFNTNRDTAYKFVGIESPTEYNFQTDRIIASASESSIDLIINEASTELIDYIDDNSQSCSGFASYYSGFDNVIRNKAVFMNYYTSWLITTKQDKEDTLYEMKDFQADMSDNKLNSEVK